MQRSASNSEPDTEFAGHEVHLNPTRAFGDQRMRILHHLALLLAVVPLFASQAAAQTPQDARITISHPGFGSLKADLKSVLELTLPAEQAQWENIEGYIDTFSIGIDDARPVYVNVMTGIKPNAILIWIPLPSKSEPFKEFRENLESLGYEVKRDARDNTLYALNQDAESGWIRLLLKERYAALILTSDKAALPGLKELILKAVLPTDKVVGNMSAELFNGDESAAAQQVRKTAYGEIRRVSMEAIQKRPSESDTEFQLRKLAVEQQMDEGERVLAELRRGFLSLVLDKKVPAAPTASLKLAATAIPGTSLADAIAQINTQPDAFAGLQKFEGSALSGRLNHPVDPMRQANFLAFLDLTEKDMADRLKASKERSEAEKTTSLKVTTGILDVIRSSIKVGWFNGFVESVPDGKGDFTSVAAFSAPAALDLTKILPELANAGKGNLVEMDVDKQGEVAIHRIQLAEGYIDMVDRVFGAKKDLFVGVGPAHVWLASGVNGKETLKSTIAGLAAPQTTDHPVHLEISCLPWVQRFEEAARKNAPGKTPEELEIQREWARRRARAIASMQNGGDRIVLDFHVKNGEVLGDLTMEHGLLRFAGKMMSAFSKANFE